MEPVLGNGWSKHAERVMYQLSEINHRLELHSRELHHLRVDVSMLRVKAGIWGIVGGAIPVAIAIAMKAL